MLKIHISMRIEYRDIFSFGREELKELIDFKIVYIHHPKGGMEVDQSTTPKQCTLDSIYLLLAHNPGSF